MSDEAKKHICPTKSSNDTSKPLLQDLELSLQVFLVEAGMVNMGLAEGISKAVIKKRETKNVHQSTMGALERARELHANMVKDNRKLLEWNRRL